MPAPVKLTPLEQVRVARAFIEQVLEPLPELDRRLKELVRLMNEAEAALLPPPVVVP